jgi:Ala-tRNA(Pro) deacylase
MTDPGPTETSPARRDREGRARLFAFLESLGIETTTLEHAAVFTVAEAQRWRGEIAGGHCKSLFLKDKKGGLWLVVADEERQVDLKALARQLGAPRFSFAKPELLREVLGIEPGAVTPFALINDPEHRVRVVLDQAMLEHELLNYHPLSNDATTTIRSDDLEAFVAACGHQTYITDLDRP